MNKLFKSFFIWAIVNLASFPLASAQQLQIHIIDVGQGASELVIGPDGTTILIDGGTSYKGYNEVVPYLNAIFPAGSRHLDYVIASHDDADHYGGLISVLNSGYTAGTIYHCGDNSSFGRGVQIPLGLLINLGNGARATCVGRYGQFIDGSSGSTGSNNLSICLLIEYNVFDYLTAGDLEGNEDELSKALITCPAGNPYLDPAYGVDVIHVNHHGSDGSSKAIYVNRLKHQLAVINGGTNYGHPRWTAVDRLKGKAYYSDGSGATGVTWRGGRNVYRTTYDIEENGRAPEWDCPTLDDMVITYDGCAPNYYFEGTSYPLDEPSNCITPTPTPETTPTPVTMILDSGDYDGDGTTDITIFRRGSGLWAVRGVTRIYFGSSSDLPVCGDYDGDGTTDPAIFRGYNGLWAIQGITRLYFGGGDDIPVPGDYDRDGICDPGIFRKNSGLWAIRGLTRVYFGGSGDLPVPGYYRGNAAKSIAVFRPANGLWAIRGLTRVYFGDHNDRPVPADYTGNGTEEIGVFRRQSGLWAIRGTTRCYFGGETDRTVRGHFDGDAGAEFGIFRESNGLWAIKKVSRAYFGGLGDLPLGAPPCRPVTPTVTPTPSSSPTPGGYKTPTPRIWDGEVVINEILADVPPYTDVNGDGVLESWQEEFVELVNWTCQTVNLGGCIISDDYAERYTFPQPFPVPPGSAVVVFGGGAPSGDFGGAQVVAVSVECCGLSLTNGGDTVKLRDGECICDSVTYGEEGNYNQSLNRDPEIWGSFTFHSEIPDSGGSLYSPGTRVNGDPFECEPSPVPTRTVTPTPSPTPTAAPSPSPSPSPTPHPVTPTPPPTPAISSTPTPITPTPTTSATPTPSATTTPPPPPTPSVTPTTTASVTPTSTPSVTPTPTPSVTPTFSPTATP